MHTCMAERRPTRVLADKESSQKLVRVDTYVYIFVCRREVLVHEASLNFDYHETSDGLYGLHALSFSIN